MIGSRFTLPVPYLKSKVPLLLSVTAKFSTEGPEPASHRNVTEPDVFETNTPPPLAAPVLIEAQNGAIRTLSSKSATAGAAPCGESGPANCRNPSEETVTVV